MDETFPTSLGERFSLNMPTYNLIKTKASVAAEPIVSTRTWAQIPLANISLEAHHQTTLAAAGCSYSKDEVAAIKVHPQAWLDPIEVIKFFDDSAAGELQDAAGESLITYKERGKKIHYAQKSFLMVYSWDILKANELAVALNTVWENKGIAHSSLYVDGKLSVGSGTKILPGVVIEGEVIIGSNCKIGPNCYIRGSTSIGHQCHIGQAVEIKNSVIFNQTNVGHLSYIGDSILGEKVNLGAGTTTSNLRHDGKTHSSKVADKLVDTGRRKFGTVIGDNVHTGINTSIYPGRKIWPGLTTRPADIVIQDLH